MADDSRPRRKAFGPLFYSTSIVAVILLSIYAVVEIRDSVGDRLRERLEMQSLQQLVDAARDERKAVREQAFRSLVEQSEISRSSTGRPPHMRVAIPVFLAGSSDRDEDVRIEAARGLGVVVNASPEDREACLQALRRLLKDPSSLVRNTAFEGVAAFVATRGAQEFEGRAAIIDEFSAMLSDADRDARFMAAKALLAVHGGRDQAAVDAMLALLADPEPLADRYVVLSELVKHGQQERALNILTSLLDRRDPLVLPDVLSCIERLGPEAAAAVPKLETLLDDEDPGIRAGAGMAIVTIEGGPTPRTIALSVKAVSDQELPMDWRVAAVEAVLGSKPAALSPAAGDLMKQLASDDPAVRRNAFDLLSLMVDLVRPEVSKPDPGP